MILDVPVMADPLYLYLPPKSSQYGTLRPTKLHKIKNLPHQIRGGVLIAWHWCYAVWGSDATVPSVSEGAIPEHSVCGSRSEPCARRYRLCHGGKTTSPPPQHSTVPSFLTPQVWCHPALTEVNSPSGGVARPKRSSPQQATEPSVLTPQVWLLAALTEMNFPSGGVAWPSSFKPQHWTEPSDLNPQVWLPPGSSESLPATMKQADPPPTTKTSYFAALPHRRINAAPILLPAAKSGQTCRPGEPLAPSRQLPRISGRSLELFEQ